jgi:hypothetical protein
MIPKLGKENKFLEFEFENVEPKPIKNPFRTL